jgi:hypothetical protein
VIASVTQKNLGAALCECVSKEAIVEPLEAVESTSGGQSLARRIPTEEPGWFEGFNQYRRRISQIMFDVFNCSDLMAPFPV